MLKEILMALAFGVIITRKQYRRHIGDSLGRKGVRDGRKEGEVQRGSGVRMARGGGV